MTRQTIRFVKRLLLACIPFLALSFSMPVIADETSPKPGSYCPGPDILLIVAEELSASLDLAMRSRTALANKNQATAISTLTSAGTTLHLAASRGAAARTNLLIDAIIQARASENYTKMLAWFPLLQTSLKTLPADATSDAADDLIRQSVAIMEGAKEGNPIKPLKAARHLLACDGLDIPLQEAIQAQNRLRNQLDQPTTGSAYDLLINSLRSALAYSLGNGAK